MPICHLREGFPLRQSLQVLSEVLQGRGLDAVSSAHVRAACAEVTHHMDPVPHVPPENLGFSHLASEAACGDWAFIECMPHPQVFYDGDVSHGFKTCAQARLFGVCVASGRNLNPGGRRELCWQVLGCGAGSVPRQRPSGPCMSHTACALTLPILTYPYMSLHALPGLHGAEHRVKGVQGPSLAKSHKSPASEACRPWPHSRKLRLEPWSFRLQATFPDVSPTCNKALHSCEPNGGSAK